MATLFFQLELSSCSHFTFSPAANFTESTSKILSPFNHYLAQVTTFSHLDSSISFRTGLIALILALWVLILNTTAKMIHLKWKPVHATLLHLTQKKSQSPNNGLQGSPFSGTRPSLPSLPSLPSCSVGSGQQSTLQLQSLCICLPFCWKTLPPDAAGPAPHFL